MQQKRSYLLLTSSCLFRCHHCSVFCQPAASRWEVLMLHHCRDILSGIIELLSPDPLLAPHVNICHALQAEVHRFPSFGKQTYYYLLFFFKHMMTGVFRGFIGCVNPDGFILVWCYDITEQMVLKWHFWTDRNQEILETVSNVHILPLGFFFMFLCHPINLPHPKKKN